MLTNSDELSPELSLEANFDYAQAIALFYFRRIIQIHCIINKVLTKAGLRPKVSRKLQKQIFINNFFISEVSSSAHDMQLQVFLKTSF